MVNKIIPKANFIIIGSAKCGTTTLADVLSTHPDCCFSRPKEVSFFSNDINYLKGSEWYQQHFLHYSNEKLIGEGTPNYSNEPRHCDCAKRIYEYNPDSKIIYITRNPYKKILSAWGHHYFMDELNARKGFDFWIKFMEEEHQFLQTCQFDYQLSFYRKFFQEDKILTLFLEDWIKDPEIEAKKLCDFLGLDFSKLGNFGNNGSNKAENRQVEKKLFKRLKDNKQLKLIWKLFPSSLKSRFGLKYGMKPFKIPDPEISDDTKNRIISFIRPDAASFLKKNNKLDSFWIFD